MKSLNRKFDAFLWISAHNFFCFFLN